MHRRWSAREDDAPAPPPSTAPPSAGAWSWLWGAIAASAPPTAEAGLPEMKPGPLVTRSASAGSSERRLAEVIIRWKYPQVSKESDGSDVLVESHPSCWHVINGLVVFWPVIALARRG